jgi:hypothetical protein
MSDLSRSRWTFTPAHPKKVGPQLDKPILMLCALYRANGVYLRPSFSSRDVSLCPSLINKLHLTAFYRRAHPSFALPSQKSIKMTCSVAAVQRLQRFVTPQLKHGCCNQGNLTRHAEPTGTVYRLNVLQHMGRMLSLSTILDFPVAAGNNAGSGFPRLIFDRNHDLDVEVG